MCRKVSRLADAVANPGAVVVEFADTVVADGAVRAARRPVVVARVAPLCAHCEPVHVVLPCLHIPASHQCTSDQPIAVAHVAPLGALHGPVAWCSLACTLHFHADL